MDEVYNLPFFVVPIGMFLGGFIVARQFRSLENVPSFSLIFVRRRFLFSVIMGGLISLLFATILLLTTEFSLLQLLILIGFFLLATLSYYYGVTFGWGRAKTTTDNVTSEVQPQTNDFPENVVMENQPSSIRIVINTKKRWGLFAMSVLPLPIMICVIPLAGFAVFSLLQKSLPNGLNILAGFLVAGIVLYGVYQKIQEVLEFLFDKEIIEIDNSSVRIEKYGSGFKSIKEYPADNIKKITTLFSFAGGNIVIKRSPFVNQNMPMFILWHEHGLKRYRYFGRGLDMADAQRILESVYIKYPQYRG